MWIDETALQVGTSSAGLSDYSDVVTPETAVGTFVSLYAGAGGMDIGFALAGFRPTWVSELNGDALASHEKVMAQLRKKHPHLAEHEHVSVAGDILGVLEENLPQPGSADLVIGGPPCQGFSVAGKMDPDDPRSKHVFHFLDVVERVAPKAFVLENVKALYQNTRWKPIRESLVERAEALGYRTLLTLANAADFGVPQARERMFLIGVRNDVGSPLPPLPTSAKRQPTVKESFGQLPPYGLPGNDTFCVAKITLAKTPILRRSPFAGMLFNGAGRPLDLDAPALTLAASMGGNKTPIVDQRLIDSASNSSWVRSYHERLWNPSLATERTPTDIPASLRRLTVEEAAALQTFPLGMQWAGGTSSKFRQIGNAVPPRLALAVALAVRKSLQSGLKS